MATPEQQKLIASMNKVAAGNLKPNAPVTPTPKAAPVKQLPAVQVAATPAAMKSVGPGHAYMPKAAPGPQATIKQAPSNDAHAYMATKAAAAPMSRVQPVAPVRYATAQLTQRQAMTAQMAAPTGAVKGVQGRSASAPGQLKKEAGVQSARSYAQERAAYNTSAGLREDVSLRKQQEAGVRDRKGRLNSPAKAAAVKAAQADAARAAKVGGQPLFDVNGNWPSKLRDLSLGANIVPKPKPKKK